MKWYTRVAVVLALFSVSVPRVEGQGSPAKPKAKVELRWVEGVRIEGLTEDMGFKATCDDKSIVYPHKKPAIVLTAAEVAATRLTKVDFSKSSSPSLGELYLVTIDLTKEARFWLAMACEGDETRYLTVVVDDKYWGVHRYEKDEAKTLIPEQARAKTFTPSVGYLSSKAEADRLMDALKK